jgi:hypothetical protein
MTARSEVSKNTMKFLAPLGLALLSGLASAQSTIDSTAGWLNKQSGCVTSGNCSNGFGAGPNAITTIGQTIYSGDGGMLKSFSFYLNQQAAGFKAYVYHWTQDATDPANNLQFNDGPALFTSATTTTGSVPANGAFKSITVNFGNGVLMNPNDNYIVMISTSQVQTAQSPGSMYGTTTTDSYTGGQLVYAMGGLTPAQLGNSTTLSLTGGNLSMWDCTVGYPCGNGVDGGDLAFKAVIAAVPEPKTYAMLLAGLGLIGASLKRREAKQT